MRRAGVGMAVRAGYESPQIGRGERIRTFDLLNPIQVRYQAALRPDRFVLRYSA